MERLPDYKFRLGQRVVARNSSHDDEAGIIVSRRLGSGTPHYVVHLGQDLEGRADAARRAMIKELKIIVRAHCGVNHGLCPLCGQSSQGARTGTGLYDNGAHLGDLCRQCLQGGRRGASARTRLHSAELRRLAECVQEHSHNPVCQPCYPWLRRYADFLENLATRLEGMPDWLPRSS